MHLKENKDTGGVAPSEKESGTKIAHWRDFFSVKDLAHDAIIGFADGLTVPFALTAGLSSLGSNRVVVVGGLAELFAGSISMGLGAWLAVNSEKEYFSFKKEEHLQNLADNERTGASDSVQDFLHSQGLSDELISQFMLELTDCDHRGELVMKLLYGLEKPKSSRAWISAFTMGVMYFVGGIFPMIPYFVMRETNKALFVSIGITVAILLFFGVLKSMLVTKSKRRLAVGAFQTLAVGCIAAGASYGIVKAVNSSSSLHA